MSWIHCNKCAARKSGGNRFYITNCKHLFCNLCVDLTNPTCLVCSTKCKVLEVNKDLPPSVKAMFGNNDGQLAAYKESVKFQNDQMLSFIQKNKGCVEAYQKKKEDTIKMKEQLNALSRALSQERELVGKLRGAFKKLPGQPDTVSPRILNESPVSPGILDASAQLSRTPDVNRTRSSGYGSLSGSSGPSTSVPSLSPATAASGGTAHRCNKQDMYRKMMEAKRQRDGE